MKRTENTEEAYQTAINHAAGLRKEFLTPEMLLWGIVQQEPCQNLLMSYQCDPEKMLDELEEEISLVDSVPEDADDYQLLASQQMVSVMTWSDNMAASSGHDAVDVPHLLHAILNLEQSAARYLLMKHTTPNKAELLSAIVAAYNDEELGQNVSTEEEESWRKLVTCVNDLLKDHNPLIGRDAELERTIQVLCRKEKNNPLHIGEPGVGKTALVYGLAARIEAGDVPERLRGAKIYQMDMGSMVAGASYRGDFEKRIKAVMDGVMQEGNAIVYIDEIHTLVGAGAGGDQSLDGSNMLKPYLEGG